MITRPAKQRIRACFDRRISRTMRRVGTRRGPASKDLSAMITRYAALVSGLLLATSVTATAQTWDDRLFVNVSIGTQGGTTTSAFTIEQTIYEEPATFSTTREVKGGLYYDIAAGRPLSGNFGLAFSFSGRSSKTDGAFTGTIPDPAGFDSPRTVTGTIADMEHSEGWFSVLAAYFLKVDEKMDVIIMAGPTFVSVNHDAPTDMTVTETATGPTVAATVESLGKTFTGIDVGADLRYMFTPRLGAGAFIGFAKATGDITEGTELSVGGFRFGGGVRVRF
jgi:hypothetical protein